MSNQMKIVAVIDDDPRMRCSITTLLSAFGYAVETYDSAESFLTLATSCNAFCLLVDIQLGEISGVEFAHRLAADGFKFPIIFMTGLDDAAVKKQADAAGGIAFLHKPFPTKMLIDAMNKALEQSKTR